MHHAKDWERSFIENAEIHRVFMAAKKHLFNPVHAVVVNEIHQLFRVQILTNDRTCLFITVTRTAGPNTECRSKQNEE